MKINLKNNKVEVEPIEPITITMTIMTDDFEKTFGRLPDSQEEFQQFTDLCQVGIENQLNWDVIQNAAKVYMELR